MGAGCCKSDDVHNIRLQNINQIFPLSSSPPEKRREPSDFTVYDSVNRSLSSIRWQRGDLIGEGVYGKVYQAMNLDSGELLAVKTYKLHFDPEIAERNLINIKRELTILKSLDHPNIIKYFQVDYSAESNAIDILMEYVPSGSMLALLSKYRAFSESVIRNYTKQLLEGLEYLHSKGIVHRDLKSANILITENSSLKLTDFGCSRQFDSEAVSQSKSFKGSPYWMAPEMVRNEGHSFPTDIWSLGCLVIEMANGKPPWSNYSKYSKEVLKLIARPGNLPDLPKTSKALNAFLKMCLQRDPRMRATAKELLEHEFVNTAVATRCYDSIRSSHTGSVKALRNAMSVTSLDDVKKEL